HSSTETRLLRCSVASIRRLVDLYYTRSPQNMESPTAISTIFLKRTFVDRHNTWRVCRTCSHMNSPTCPQILVTAYRQYRRCVVVTETDVVKCHVTRTDHHSTSICP